MRAAKKEGFRVVELTPTPDDIKELVKRLRAPAYWMSGSGEGHEGETDIPLKAADALEALAGERDRLKAAIRLIASYGDAAGCNPASFTEIARKAEVAS